MEYRIEITETLQRIIRIIAESEDEALMRVKQMYGNCDIILSDSDFIGVEIEIQEKESDAIL